MLDVDELGAGVEGRLENSSPLLLAAAEMAAFPGGTARDQDGAAAPLEGTEGVGAVNAVEPQLDQVGLAGGRVPRPAHRVHRGGRDGHAK